MTLLTICETASDETGLTRQTTIINNNSTTARRLLRYAHRTGRDLVRKSFPYLVKEGTFSTVDAQSSYDFSSDMSITDFDHFVPFTQWNRTASRRAFQVVPSEWQEFKSGLSTVSLNLRYRIRGKNESLLLYPTPTSVETVAFEYVSQNYCQTAASSELSVWTNDTDTGIVDEEFFEMGIIWRILNRMGLPYAEEKAEYQRVIDVARAQIGAGKIRADGYRPTISNIPDANWPT